ncbi:50S ribosomal protein L21 [Candidatus Peregrinibacteria bacterium]|jgi:large subunit ribosomal protein L21|nr:50S ribosomal protein L21 [Candidatus Peregrinibacteria bacterium]MBT3598991.1 50S ribosomal protein L21 [Candidatus Peregrinibacteria bacterium]MBT4366977.1 50S ribosomal protein L21 [Candidatus Peregrinibacteria bacterium]MBT4585556.1 50S ribosomal protein L21 [Candidatus Peregrinibacteria bacterium]MBT6731298.1 50S ribosomal protein L21 [Candidatus Peregrinibacteria bacterium]
MFVIVDIAGFQEKVSEGDTLQVPTLSAKDGETVKFDNVLLVAKSDTDITVGTPSIAGASVTAKVVTHGKADKIRVFKMKRRKRYRKVQGHRQGYTNIEITKITTGGSAAPKKTATKAAPAVKKEEKVAEEK